MRPHLTTLLLCPDARLLNDQQRSLKTEVSLSNRRQPPDVEVPVRACSLTILDLAMGRASYDDLLRTPRSGSPIVGCRRGRASSRPDAPRYSRRARSPCSV